MRYVEDNFLVCPECLKKRSEVALVVVSEALLMCSFCGGLFEIVSEEKVAFRRAEIRPVVIRGNAVQVKIQDGKKSERSNKE